MSTLEGYSTGRCTDPAYAQALPLAIFSILLLLPFAHAAAPLVGTGISDGYEAFVVADGLTTPGGLALHPVTEELYVAEAEAGRISLLGAEGTVPVITDEWIIDGDLPKWAVTPEKPLTRWLETRLHNPRSLAFSKDGRLYVTEAIPDGRLLEFRPDKQGRMTRAQVIAVPWFYRGFSWSSVQVSVDGRLFLAGTATQAGPGLLFGAVLMRDTDGNWWVIDYGPFAGFSSVSLSRGHDILVVGESVNGTVTWWDTLRHRAIGTMSQSFPGLHHACPMADGAIALAQASGTRSVRSLGESETRPGLLLRVDPRNGDTTEIARDLGTISGLAVSPSNGNLYVAEEQTGRVIALRHRTPRLPQKYLLENTVQLSEVAAGLPPKKWPPFLKGFFKDLGINPRDEVVREAEQGQSFTGPNSYTLVEVGRAIPLIAGKVRTHPFAHGPDLDPIVEMDFIVLFPNRSFSVLDDAAPGLAFYSAKRESGHVERTYTLEHLKALKYDQTTGWSLFANKATVFLPTATCAVTPREDGMDVQLAFISLHGGHDYFLQLECGASNTGRLIDDAGGGSTVSYGIDFTEETLDGAAYNTLVVAGFGEQDSDRPGWLNIGNWPMDYALNPEQSVPWMPHSAGAGPAVLEALWGVNQPADEQEH